MQGQVVAKYVWRAVGLVLILLSLPIYYVGIIAAIDSWPLSTPDNLGLGIAFMCFLLAIPMSVLGISIIWGLRGADPSQKG